MREPHSPGYQTHVLWHSENAHNFKAPPIPYQDYPHASLRVNGHSRCRSGIYNLRSSEVVAIRKECFDTSMPLIGPAWKQNRHSGSGAWLHNKDVQICKVVILPHFLFIFQSKISCVRYIGKIACIFTRVINKSVLETHQAEKWKIQFPNGSSWILRVEMSFYEGCCETFWWN